MEIIRRQVEIARRRLMLQRFGYVVTRTLFVLLIVALIGAAVPKFTTVPLASDVWILSWVVGAVGIAFVTASFWTFWRRPSLRDTAAEVDQRFALRERLSSSLSLTEEDLDTDMGKALLTDAARRAEKISVRENFSLRFNRAGLLPLLPAVFFVVLIFVPDATRENVVDANANSAAQQEVERVKIAAKQLKKRLEQRRREAAAEGLKEAEDLFKKLERQADDISKRDDIKKKEALIALNDIKKQLEERREKLGSPDQMRKALSGMKDMENGPGEKIAKSLEKGDFGEAKEEIQKLADKLKDGSLTEEEKKQLAEQMGKLQEKINEATQQHEQAKQQLQQQIDEAKREGRGEDAARLQQKLNEMRQMDGQMQQLQEMSDAMQAAQQALQQGDSESAAEQMKQIADQLGEMQDQMEQLEDLQDAMDQLSQAKDQMGCKSCGGQGCPDCQGGGQGQQQEGLGDGLGKGQGQGDRPEEETDTNSYDSQVRGQPKQGKAVLAGRAGGENKKGLTRQSVQDAVLDAMTDESDPLEDQVLPRKEREHTEQYFNRLRDGDR